MNKRVLLKALLVMLLWGSLFPCIKLSYSAFAIDTGYIPNLLLFAGLRFSLSGPIIAIAIRRRKQAIIVPSKKAWYNVLAVSLFAVILHYSFTYIGLSQTASGITALLKQMGAILFICFSFLFIKEEKFEIRKIFAAVFGMAGILSLNIGSFSVNAGIGELLIIGASFCTVLSGIFSKNAMKEYVSPLSLTCCSQFIGGMILLVIGLVCGGRISHISVVGVLLFCYICLASVAAYCLWNSILENNTLSYMLVIKFFEPLFAAIFGAVLLGEDIFNLPFLLAVLLTLCSVLIICIRKTDQSH